jgi:hypothetical protein
MGEVHESVAEKVKPLQRLSGSKTAEMGAEVSDALLRVRSLGRGRRVRRPAKTGYERSVEE